MKKAIVIIYGHFTSISKQNAVSKVHIIKALVCFHLENRKPYDFLSWKTTVNGKHLTVILAVLSLLIILHRPHCRAGGETVIYNMEKSSISKLLHLYR